MSKTLLIPLSLGISISYRKPIEYQASWRPLPYIGKRVSSLGVEVGISPYR